MNLSNVGLQPMQEADLPEAVFLVAQAMNEDEGRWAQETMEFHFSCRKNALDDGRHYYVLKGAGKTIGLVGLHRYLWGPEENVWLAWFAVHPGWQRRGIGRKLLESVEALAKDQGYRKLLVETYRQADFDAARSFYTANGFVQVGSISDYLPDGSEMMVFGKSIV